MRAILCTALTLAMVTPGAADTLVGRWRLLAAEDLRADGSVARYPWGRHPFGSIVVEGGSCYLQIMSSDTPSFGSDRPIQEQMKAALLSSGSFDSRPASSSLVPHRTRRAAGARL
jgi:hypothetical protein